MKSLLRRTSTRVAAGVVLCAIVPASMAQAGGLMAMQPVLPLRGPRQVPSHLEVGSQFFDASTEGLRAYLESIRGVDPALYAQLAPDVERLEARREGGFALLGAGLALGITSVIYGFASRDTCTEPSINDSFSVFAAKADAWGNCNEANMNHTAVFTVLGLGLVLAGSIGAAVAVPKRDDVWEVVNKRNRLTPEPMQLQLGYDPRSDFAYAGAKLTF